VAILVATAVLGGVGSAVATAKSDGLDGGGGGGRVWPQSLKQRLGNFRNCFGIVSESFGKF
jgi:hypothetical protein